MVAEEVVAKDEGMKEELEVEDEYLLEVHGARVGGGRNVHTSMHCYNMP